MRFGDFGADGRVEIFYHGFNGGAGAVPVYAGIRGWTGVHKHRFWSFSPPYPPLVHNGHHYRYVGASAVALENLARAPPAPGLEVHVVQGEARPADPDGSTRPLSDAPELPLRSAGERLAALRDGLATQLDD